MLSRVVRELELENDEEREFAKDLRSLIALPSGVLRHCLNAAPELAGLMVKGDRRQFVARLNTESEQRPEQEQELQGAVEALEILIHLLSAPIAEQDSSGAIASDLRKRCDLDESADASLTGVIENLRARAVDHYKAAVKRHTFSRGLLPSLVSVGATVELRAVLDDRYDPRSEIEEYVPDIRELIGIATLSIQTDSDEQKRFAFQLSRDELQLFIKSCQIALKELEALELRMRAMDTVPDAMTSGLLPQ